MRPGDAVTDRPSRRRVLALVAGGSVVALAGCLGGDEDVPDPVALDGGQSCDNCDMQIEMHPGPVGQAFYLDDPPPTLPDDRDDGIAHFCSSWCTYMYVRENEEHGTEPAGIYTTDYSTVDYEIREDAGTDVISAHLDREAFERAEELSYVVDSDVEGAMGASLIGFSDSDEADEFAEEYDGMVVEHDDITLEMVASL